MQRQKKRKRLRARFNSWTQAALEAKEGRALMAGLITACAAYWGWAKSYQDFVPYLTGFLFFAWFLIFVFLTIKQHEKQEKVEAVTETVSELIEFRERGEALLASLQRQPRPKDGKLTIPEYPVTAEEAEQTQLWISDLEAYVESQMGQSDLALLRSKTGLTYHWLMFGSEDRRKTYESVNYRVQRIHEFVRDLNGK